MKEVLSVLRPFVCAVALLAARDVFALTQPATPSADEIIRKAVERTKADEHQARPEYRLTKVTTREERDERGQVKDRNRNAEEIIFRNGNYIKQDSSRNESIVPLKFRNSRTDFINLLTPEVIAKYNFKIVAQTNLNNRAT